MAGQVSRPSAVGGGQPAVAERLAGLIREARSVVALTGAGISVPSGIPDFRTPGKGLWEKVDPMKVAHIDAFHRNTKEFWRFYRPRFVDLDGKSPNRAHLALAELEARGMLDAVVTQNIDRLHAKAGSERVVEVHGSIATSSCTSCRASYRLESVGELFDADGVATCACCMGKVKPDVVLFGELLPESAIAEAHRLCAGADLLLCVGSSLEVYPVAGLPELTLGSGGRIAIVTQGPTTYDGEAAVKLDGDVVEELGAVLSGALSVAEADRAAERLQDAARLIDEIAAAEDAGAASGACVAGAAAIDRRVDGARLAQALAELSESEPDERRKRIAVELARAFSAELEDEFPVWASIGLVVAALATVVALLAGAPGWLVTALVAVVAIATVRILSWRRRFTSALEQPFELERGEIDRVVAAAGLTVGGPDPS